VSRRSQHGWASLRWWLLAGIVGGLSLLVLTISVASAAPTSHPRLVPTAIGFFDSRHGVLASVEDCGTFHCSGALFVSDDSGRSWRRTLDVRGPVDIDAVRGYSLVWATTATALIQSTDRGKSWRRMLRVHAAAVSFSDPEHSWLLGADGTFARPPAIRASDDGGHSWRRLASPCHGDFGIPVAVSLASASRGWVACMTQMTSGQQGKEVWQTTDGGRGWQLRSRVHPIGPPEPALQLGNLPGRGYVTGMQFLPDGTGWLREDRGWLLTTSDGGHLWRKSPLTSADNTEARSASMLSDRTGFVLLGLDPGCNVRLARTTDRARHATTLKRWPSTTFVGC
jgi:photosystem II stability/assembly factor-like uncharacterized protein